MRKKVLFIFLSLSFSLFLGLISAELACRLFIKTPSVCEKVTYPLYDGDVDLKWKLKRSFKIRDITIDSDGFRTYKDKDKTYDAYAILALGDSHTFGMGISDEWTYPAQLEKILSTKFKQPINVINGGVPGYNTVQAVTYYKRIVKNFNPHLVLLGIVADDIQDAYNYRVDGDGNLIRANEGSRSRNEGKTSRTVQIMKDIKRAFKKHIYLVRVLTDRFPGLLIKMGFQKSALDEYLLSWRSKELLEREFQTIKEFNILVEKNNGHLILVIFPLADQLIYNRGFNDYQQQLLLFAKKENISALDLVDAYRPVYTTKKNYSSLFIYDDGHPNENGYKVIAEHIFNFIAKKNLIK